MALAKRRYIDKGAWGATESIGGTFAAPKAARGAGGRNRAGCGGRLLYQRWRGNYAAVLAYLRGRAAVSSGFVSTAGRLRLYLYAGEICIPEREIAAALGIGRQRIRTALRRLLEWGAIKSRYRALPLHKCPTIYQLGRPRPKPNPEVFSLGSGFSFDFDCTDVQDVRSSLSEVTRGTGRAFKKGITSKAGRDAVRQFEDPADAQRWRPLLLSSLRRWRGMGADAGEIPKIAAWARPAGPVRQGLAFAWLIKQRRRAIERLGAGEVLNLGDWLKKRPVWGPGAKAPGSKRGRSNRDHGARYVLPDRKQRTSDNICEFTNGLNGDVVSRLSDDLDKKDRSRPLGDILRAWGRSAQDTGVFPGDPRRRRIFFANFFPGETGPVGGPEKRDPSVKGEPGCLGAVGTPEPPEGAKAEGRKPSILSDALQKGVKGAG